MKTTNTMNKQFQENKVRKLNNYVAVMESKKALKALQEIILSSTKIFLGFG